MERIAEHLRNCPNCMEKYSTIQKRRRSLKNKLKSIENTLRMENQISSYIDYETREEERFLIEGTILASKKYKETLLKYEKLSGLLVQARRSTARKHKCINTEIVLQKIKTKKGVLKTIESLLFSGLRFRAHEE